MVYDLSGRKPENTIGHNGGEALYHKGNRTASFSSESDYRCFPLNEF